jgi:hypothetical protein
LDDTAQSTWEKGNEHTHCGLGNTITCTQQDQERDGQNLVQKQAHGLELGAAQVTRIMRRKVGAVHGDREKDEENCP